jgi:hypothetical protein
MFNNQLIAMGHILCILTGMTKMVAISQSNPNPLLNDGKKRRFQLQMQNAEQNAHKPNSFSLLCWSVSISHTFEIYLSLSS